MVRIFLPDTFSPVPYRTRTLFQDGCKNRTGRGSSTFYHFTLKATKPPSLLYPVQLSTLGDHIRKVRLDRKLTQWNVANIVGVTADCITNWELNRFSPRIQYHPKIVEFLGYDPTLKTDGNKLSNRVISFRKQHGLSRKRLAKLWRMDEKTIGRIEDGIKVFDRTINKVDAKLTDGPLA
ncbi:MAG: hypothetical protein AAFZ15_18615 [Bacteroidota bacterium]